MKTHAGKIANVLDTERNEVHSSYIDGDFYGGYYAIDFDNLTKGVEGRDMLYGEMLNELVNHRQSLQEGKQVDIVLEWDIEDDYSKYIACRVLTVESIDVRGDD